MNEDKTINVRFTIEQINNLLVFLNRVDIKGAEARVLLDIVLTFQKAAQAQRVAPKIGVPVKEEKSKGDK